MIINNLVMKLPTRDDTEFFVDNLTAIMAEEIYVVRILRHMDSILSPEELAIDDCARYIINMCHLALSMFANCPEDEVAIDTVDLIEGNNVTVTITALSGVS